MPRLTCAASRHRRPRAAAALPPTARRQHGLLRLLRRAESALVQPAQVAPAKRTMQRPMRLERHGRHARRVADPAALRFDRVVDYIEAHLDHALDLEQLAAIAGLSMRME